MNQIYGKQRYIYDASRKFYLLGRDRLINEMRPPNGGAVLEIGCGTGRNLVAAAQIRKRASYFGIDISDEMLKSANRSIERYQLCKKVKTAQADATNFDPENLFGIEKFDRIFMSYTLSMIPDWKVAIDEALEHLADNGSLHIVDFGMQTELPAWFRKILTQWLKLFHVTPRSDLMQYLETKANLENRGLILKKPFRDYACYYVMGPKRIK
ncbi:MAG: class I SAM-dependent methyltransferase [Lentilitoribacter sp.]